MPYGFRKSLIAGVRARLSWVTRLAAFDPPNRPRGPFERTLANSSGAVNRYNSHIVYIDVLNDVSVVPYRGAQSC
jgi:hypothetical protein